MVNMMLLINEAEPSFGFSIDKSTVIVIIVGLVISVGAIIYSRKG